MNGPAGNPYASNRHADVLSEHPTDDAGKLRLCEEVKNRAKGAFQQKDMPSAELLYGKAIELLEGIPGKQEAALYSNRSMVRLNLNKVEDSLKDAIKCMEVDPKFVKAYHRKAQALLRLNDYDDAIAAAKEGVAIDPSNTSFQELIDKAEKEKEKDAEDKKKLKRDAQDVRVELHNASTARSAQPKPKTEGAEDEDSSMRGYKTRADGAKTSYFHTDISDEAKKLIEAQGFGKPKKIETPSDVPGAEVKGGGSQWNQAGTYEEKGMKKWIDDRLQKGLIGVTFQIPTASGGDIKVTEVTSITGDASISCSRGKRRHLLDLSFEAKYEGKVGDNVGSGKFNFSEVSTGGDDPEVQIEINSDAPREVREVFEAFVKPAGQGLQPLVLAEIRKILDEYKAQ